MKQSIDEGKLKLLKVTCGSDLYDEVTEIGARIQILWTKDDVQKTGWKPRWSMFVIYFVLFLFVIQPLKLDIIHDTKPECTSSDVLDVLIIFTSHHSLRHQ